MWWPFKRRRRDTASPPPPTVTIYLETEEVHEAILLEAFQRMNVADQHNQVGWRITINRNTLQCRVIFTLSKPSTTRPKLTVVK